jgi:hypothetical protein
VKAKWPEDLVDSIFSLSLKSLIYLFCLPVTWSSFKNEARSESNPALISCHRQVSDAAYCFHNDIKPRSTERKYPQMKTSRPITTLKYQLPFPIHPALPEVIPRTAKLEWRGSRRTQSSHIQKIIPTMRQPLVVRYPVLHASVEQLFRLEMHAGAVLLAEDGLVFYNYDSTRCWLSGLMPSGDG